MAKPKLNVPAALGLCPECVEKHGKIVDNDTVVQAYCSHNQTGGLYQINLGIWRLSGPIDEEHWNKLSKAMRDGLRTGKKMVDAQNVNYWAGKKWN